MSPRALPSRKDRNPNEHSLLCKFQLCDVWAFLDTVDVATGVESNCLLKELSCGCTNERFLTREIENQIPCEPVKFHVQLFPVFNRHPLLTAHVTHVLCATYSATRHKWAFVRFVD